MRCIKTLFICLLLLAAAQSYADDPFIKLTGIPEKLVVPFTPGVNKVISARVSGGTAGSVWLAKDKDAKVRISLTKTGPNEYQLNLADPDVSGVLEKVTGPKRFYIFAEMSDKKIISSIAVNYSTTFVRRYYDRPSFVYFTGDGKGELQASYYGTWVEPGAVTRIEARFDKTADSLPEIHAGAADEEKWTFIPVEGKPGRMELEMTDEIRDAWQKYRKLKLNAGGGSFRRAYFVLNAIPHALEMKGNIMTMNIFQRSSESLPGSNGFLRVYIGDITGGQVLLTLSSRNGTKFISQLSMTRSQNQSFTFGKEKYNLYIRRMVNVLIGEDWIQIEITRVPLAEYKKINALLALVKASPVAFIREGKEYSSVEAETHLREKYAGQGPRIKTLDEFIEKIGSNSSTTGKPYKIKLADGRVLTANEWLKQKAREIPAEKEAP